MRSLTALTILGIALSAAPSAAVARAAEGAISFSTTRSTGSVRVSASLAAETAGAELRFVALPPGASEPTITIGAGSENFVSMLRPVVSRGVVLVPLLVGPPAAGTPGIAAAGPESIEFEVLYRESPAKKTLSDPAAFARGFHSSFDKLLVDEPVFYETQEEGGYLIVAPPEFAAALEPLARWKREMGFEVTLATTNETGTSNSEIQSWIRARYESDPVPPAYVLLVGDVDRMPGWDYHQSVSDHPYSMMDGDDFFPDLHVGRLSAATVEDVNTIVAKILGYERSPYRADPAWFSRALLVAGDYSSSTPVPVSRWCREMLYGIEFAEVDTVFYPPHWSTAPVFIRSSIDQGVSIVSYRGWAYGAQGWEPPKFTIDHIPSLNNGWKLPAVFSFVCETGNFASSDYPQCFGELWLRAGTPETPKGAVAFIGNSEHWSHTRFNDAAAIGAFGAIGEEGTKRLGEILDAAKFEIMREFPDILYYADHADESVEFYFYIYALLGDPAMDLYLGQPADLAVSTPDTIAKGSNYTFVEVVDAGSGDPIAGARVGLSQAGARLGCGFTDASGQAKVLADFSDDSSPVVITVTGPGLYPYRDSVEIASSRPHLALAGVAILDDGTGRSRGNGDGFANPGETLELRASLRNPGAATATGVSGMLVGLGGGFVLESALVDFPDIGAGATAASETTWVVHVDEDLDDGRTLRFLLQAFAGGTETDNGFDLAVRAPELRREAHALSGDGLIDPGESVSLSLTLRNGGSAALPPVSLILRSETPEIARTLDSTSALASLAPGAAGAPSDPFTIQATDSAAVGQGAVFTLVYEDAAGTERVTSFTIVIGAVSHRAPLGPDAYGYYAYDNSDTDYPDGAPLYEWFSCSPLYGGSGTNLELGDNDFATITLPFPFRYYGRTYTRLLVSDNGWASFDTIGTYDFYNWSMPNLYGAAAQIAPFWDNLDPEKEYEGERVGDGVYTCFDEANHRFVIEWSRLGNLRPHHENRLDYDELQTFEMILYDPDHHSTPTGDGPIRFQYRQIVNNDFDRMFATVGIEDETEKIGLEYGYANLYPVAAAPLSPGLAIEFTTRPPRFEPFSLASFRAKPAEGGIELAWEPCDDRPRGSFVVYRAGGADGPRRAIGPGPLPASARGYLDREADSESLYTYWIGSMDPVGTETLLGPFAFSGGRAERGLVLFAPGPNPSRGSALIRYALPSRERLSLRIYAVSGRLVRTLVDGEAAPGEGAALWDGRDEDGREAPSGVYFARLETVRERRAVKLLLLR